MDRPWLRHYPPGVPADIDPSRYPSLVAMLEEAFTAYAEREACVCMGKTLSYGELDETSRAFAAWLQSRGLKHGARVAIMMPNVLQYPVAIAAILRAGCTVVNVNPLYKPRELEFQLTDAGAEAIIVLENFAAVLQQALPNTPVKHVVVASLGDMLGRVKGALVNAVIRHVKKMVPAYAIPAATMFNDALAAGRKSGFTPAAIGPDDIAFLQYTGGTTGVAKGAMLTHRNLVANMLQVEAWNQPMVDLPPKTDQLIIVTALPLYHIFALTACFLFGMRTGGMCLLIPNPRDIAGVIKELRHYKVNLFPAVNTLYNALLHQSGLRQDRLEHAQSRDRRRHGGAEIGRRCLGQGHRQADHRRLRTFGNLAGAHVQSRRHRRMDRHHRIAVAFDGNFDPRRRWPRTAERRTGRNLRARPASDVGLLAAPGGDRARR